MTDADIGRYCGGDQMAQWERYIGLDGQPLDRGYRIEDFRYRELDRRLGLADPRTENMVRAD